MSDFRRLVDDIQSILRSVAPPDEERLSDLAAEHASLCAEVNDRLRKCMGLLDQGLRSEAIQQCNIEPSLLDVVAALDFPELPQWLDLLAQRNVYGPPALLLEAATALNQAYAKELPLAALLAKHRWLGLARAPLSMRIEILAEISRRDPQTLVWQEDLRGFQRARLTEIARELPAAINSQDGLELERLNYELEAGEWLVPPLPAMLASTQQALGQVKRREAKKRLAEIEPALNAAYAALDADTARELRDQWNQWITVANPAGDEEVLRLSAPALEWLAEEDLRDTQVRRFEKALATLEELLSDPRSKLIDLDAAYQRVRKIGCDFPEGLETRYQDYVQSRRRRRRQLRWLAAAAAVLLLACGVLGVRRVIDYQRHSTDIATAAAELAELLDANRLAEAEERVERLRNQNPAVLDSAEIDPLIQELREKQGQELARVARFNQFMSAAQGSGPEQPDAAALQKARALAKTEEEKQRVEKFETQIATVMKQSQYLRDAGFARQLQDVNECLDKLKRSAMPDDEVREKMEALQSLTKTLANQRGEISPSVFDRLSEVNSRLVGIRKDFDRSAQRRSREQRITESVGDAAAFAQQLKNFVDAVPGDPRVNDFTAVALEQSFWEGLAQWDALALKWNAVDRKPMSVQDVASYIAQIKRLQGLYPNSVQAEEFGEILRHLEAIARRSPSGNTPGPITALKSLLAEPLVAEVQMIQTTNGQRFYLLAKVGNGITELAGKTSFRYIVDVNLNPSKKPAKFEKIDIRYNGKAPHAQIGQALCEKLVALNDALVAEAAHDAMWEKTFAQILGDVLVYDPKATVDPIVTAILLTNVLSTASQGSRPLELGLGPMQKLVGGLAPVLSTNWMDPEDQAAERARALAIPILRQVTDLQASAKKTAGKSMAKFRNGSVPRIRWVGWLNRDSQLEWRCIAKQPENDSGDLFVIGAPTNRSEKPAGTTTIGSLTNGQFRLKLKSGDALKEGRPIFLLQNDSSSPPGS